MIVWLLACFSLLMTVASIAHFRFHARRKEFVLNHAFCIMFLLISISLEFFPDTFMAARTIQILWYLLVWGLYWITLHYIHEVFDISEIFKAAKILSAVIFFTALTDMALLSYFDWPWLMEFARWSIVICFALLIGASTVVTVIYRRIHRSIFVAIFLVSFVAFTFVLWAIHNYTDLDTTLINQTKNLIFVIVLTGRTVLMALKQGLVPPERTDGPFPSSLEADLSLFPDYDEDGIDSPAPSTASSLSAPWVLIMHGNPATVRRLSSGLRGHIQSCGISSCADISSIPKDRPAPEAIIGSLYLPDCQIYGFLSLGRAFPQWDVRKLPFLILDWTYPWEVLQECLQYQHIQIISGSLSPHSLAKRLESIGSPDGSPEPASLELTQAELMAKCLPYQLTSREIEIAHYIIKGMGYSDISSTLHISPNTLKRHVTHIYSKCGVTNRHMLSARLRS